MHSFVPLFVPGGPEILIIFFIAVLLFGANRIPKISRAMGESLGAFKKGQEQAEQELEEMRKETQINPDDEDNEF